MIDSKYHCSKISVSLTSSTKSFLSNIFAKETTDVFSLYLPFLTFYTMLMDIKMVKRIWNGKEEEQESQQKRAQWKIRHRVTELTRFFSHPQFIMWLLKLVVWTGTRKWKISKSMLFFIFKLGIYSVNKF